MEITSEYFSQRLDQKPSKKLTTKQKPGKSKASKSNNSNQSKRRSSTFFKDFFRVDSPTNESNASKKNVHQPAASGSFETSEKKTSLDAPPQQSLHQNEEETDKADIYMDNTLIVKKSEQAKLVEPGSNIYLDDTLTSFSDKKKEQSENKTVPKSEPSEDVRWKRLNELKRCPVCLKKFDKLVSHIKSCASKHGITTEQLFKAIDLQLKQNEERAALGFLSSQVIKPPTTLRRTASSKGPKDASLELALALSLSLQESKMNTIIKETDALMEMGLEDEAIKQRKALEQFSLPETANRPAPKTSKSTTVEKRKFQSKLFSRSKEDRECILAEKVAVVLMGNDCPWDDDLDSPKAMKSRIHSKYKKKSKNLWQLAKEEIESNDQFYVPDLSDVIAPCSEDIYARLKSKGPSHDFDSPIKSDAYLEEIFKTETTSNCATSSMNPKSSTAIPNAVGTSLHPKINVDQMKSNCVYKSGPKQSKSMLRLKDLSKNWRHMLGNKMLSDLKIISKEEKEIPAHKIVLFARCPNILNDLITETDSRTNSQNHLLVWSNYSSRSINFFLEFLYCAEVDVSKLDDGHVKSELFNLAENYKAISLIQYLHGLDSSSKSDNFNFSDATSTLHVEKAPKTQSVVRSLYSKSPSCDLVETQKEREDISTLKGSVDSQAETVKLDKNLSRSQSPDIFSCSGEVSPNNSILENHPDNLMRLVESIQKLNEQENPEHIHDALVDLSGECKKDSPGVDLESGVISSAEEGPSCPTGNPEIDQENTDSTHYDGNHENSEASATKHLPDEDCKSSHNSFPRKRKSSVSSARGDNAKKTCLEDEKNIVSVDLTLESSNSNSTKINYGLDNVSETCSLPDIDFIGTEHNINCDNTSAVNCNVSTVSLPADKGKKSEDDKSESQSLPHASPTTGDELRDEGNSETNYGYISPFWEAFDEGCGVFSAAVESPVRLDSRTEVSSADTVVDEDARQISSREKVVLLSGSTSHLSSKSSPDVIALSPENHSPNESVTNPTSPIQLVNQSGNSISLSPLNSVQLNSPSDSVWPSKTSSPIKSAYEVKTNSNVPCKSGRASENFANDSLFLNESLLNQIEINSIKPAQDQNEREEVMRTPSPHLQGTSDVTPMLDYSVMKTAQIKNELLKYGLKPTLGKKKGKVLLRYIYGELHPTVDSMSCQEHTSNIKEPEENDQGSSSESHVSETDSENDDSNQENEFDYSFSSETSTLPENNFSEVALKSLTIKSRSKFMKKDELEQLVLEAIKSDRSLYKTVLMYEPLWLEKFQETLEKKRDLKCRPADLIDVLDKKCITFRTASSVKRNARRSARSKNKRAKAARTRSQPIKSPRRGRRRKNLTEEAYASD